MNQRRRHPSTGYASKGFTLLEHAVSLSVIALLLGSVMVPLQTQLNIKPLFISVFT